MSSSDIGRHRLRKLYGQTANGKNTTETTGHLSQNVLQTICSPIEFRRQLSPRQNFAMLDVFMWLPIPSDSLTQLPTPTVAKCATDLKNIYTLESEVSVSPTRNNPELMDQQTFEPPLLIHAQSE